jgi:hypothetical protein
MTWEEIENRRDRIYCRTPLLQVKSIDEALDFVNQIGFCFAFKANNSELPCLWHAAAGERKPVYPKHVQHDPYIGLVWQAKDDLPHSKKIYYGKALKNRPSMISLEFIPYFYRLSRSSMEPDAYLADYMAGNLSSEAKRIMDAMTENSPQITSDLKIAAGFSNPKSRSAFDKAMAELQMKMYIVKIGEFYDPFTFLWDLVDRRFESELQNVQKVSRQTAIEKILIQYFKIVLIAKAIDIERLFKWPKFEIEEMLDKLVNEDFIQDEFALEDKKGSFFARLE